MVAQQGERAVLFFLVNRPDGRHMRAAKEIDPLYASELSKAMEAGVEVLAYRAATDLKEVGIGEAVPRLIRVGL